jgi:hypothetical protein
MKNRILVFLVFITTILKGQSVDPETFPTVVGAISGKNLYTNTGGEGKVSIKAIMDSVDILDTATITYADFYTAITGGNLVVGKTYIIVDFQTIYDQMDFDAGGSLKPTLTTKTGSVEQIWVYALSSNQIAKKAYSATYPNDQIQYDWTYNTTLVNGSPAKGRISERIDENNNRTDYDHREIKFIRYDDGAGNFTVINDNGNASGEFLTFVQNFTGGIVKDNWLGDFYSIGALLGQEYGNNVFSGSFVVSNTSSAAFYSNTFSGDVNNNTFSGGNVYNNTFSGYVNNNTFSGYVYDNTFSGDVYNNTFSGEVYSNTFSGDVYDNTFSGIVTNNTFSGEVYNNTFRGYVYNTTFSGKVYNNTFSGYVNSNTFSGGDVYRNTFSGYVNSNTFSGYVMVNTFSGGDVRSNTFSGNVYNNTFSGNITNNTFTYPGFLKYVTIADALQFKTINVATYPFLFNTDYKKEILQGSNGSNYIRYFDGTADVNTLIP